MNPRQAVGHDGLGVTDWRRVDAQCDRFEAAWSSGEPPDLSTFLAEASGAVRAALFRELLALDLAARRALGESPEPRDYRERFPDDHEAIDAAFATDRQTLPSGPGNIGLGTTGFDVAAPRPGPARIDPAALGALREAGYEVLEELGRGGMGIVYLARKLALNRLCALKMIRAGGHAGPAALARFRSEAEAVARLRHPGIVQVYHVGEADTLPYIELEYLPGGGLDKRLDGTPWPAPAAAGLVEVLARAIAEAHRQGVVHRDLKPANILLDPEGRPKVADFGLAKFLDSDDGPTRTQAILGTPCYMAPEQAGGDSRAVGPTADAYALGAILYELVTGRPPFRAATALGTLAQIKESDPVPPSRIQPGLPRDIDTICLKCLEKAPARRYATADALAEDLRRFLAGETILARPASTREKAWAWARRRPASATAAAIVAAMVPIVLGGGLYYNAQLRAAVRQARSAQHAADEQRNLALKALEQLVSTDREEPGRSPAARSLRRRQLATAVLVLGDLARGAEETAPDLNRAVAHQKLGDIFRQVGQTAEARGQYNRARTLAEGLAEPARRDVATEECLRGAGFGLSMLELQAGQYRIAIDHLRRVVALSESIERAAPARDGARQARLEAYLQLGRAHAFAGDMAEAKRWFQAMNELARRWVADGTADLQVKDLLSASDRKLGDVGKLTGDPEEARRNYLQAIAIAREVVAADPGNPTFKGHLATALHDLAGVAAAGRRPDEARALFQEAVRLFAEQAAADPEDPTAQSWALRAQFDLGGLERDQGRFAEAADHFRQVYARLLHVVEAGRLRVPLPTDPRRFDHANQEAADCEAAPLALRPLDVVRARPAPESCRLLAARARLLTSRGPGPDLTATIDALLSLDPGEGDILIEKARGLASLVDYLANDPRAESWALERRALRQRCAEGALAALGRAVERGLVDSRRIESDEALAPLRREPGYRRLVPRPTTALTPDRPEPAR
jgi:tetratricopeptide (TPR) repeat protein